MFTSWAAYGGFHEHRRGKIKTGYDADLTIMNNNILDIPSTKILDTKILYTIVNGKII
jgi:predicted amidohydrolase YtcJ